MKLTPHPSAPLVGFAWLLALGGCGLPESGVPGRVGALERLTPAVDIEAPGGGASGRAPPAKADGASWTRRVVDLPVQTRRHASNLRYGLGPSASACERRCGDDPGCAALCLQGEMAEASAGDPMGEDCLVCGRETGFLPKPSLRVRDRDEAGVWLEWDAVPGATEYVLHALRWNDEGPDGSLELHTISTSLYVSLEPDRAYTFYVIARDPVGKRRSPPSAPVHVTP